jgi:hypothetical protein
MMEKDEPVNLARRKTLTWPPVGVLMRAPEARPSASCCIVRREVRQQSAMMRALAASGEREPEERKPGTGTAGKPGTGTEGEDAADSEEDDRSMGSKEEEPEGEDRTAG